MIALRPATPDDAPAIAALVRALSGPALLSPDGAGAEPFFASVDEAAQRRYLLDGRHDYRVVVDEADGSLAAVGAMRDGRHLFHLFVAPAHQGRGLARRLWTVLHDAATRAGHAGPFTVNSTLAAVPVYRRFGFAPIGDVQRTHGIACQPMRLDPPGASPGRTVAE